MRRTAVAAQSFGVGIAVIVAIGLVVRVAAAFWMDAHLVPHGDAIWYLDVARLVVRGPGFVEPVTWFASHQRIATAAHPPLYPLYQAGLEVVGGHSTLAHRLWTVLPAAGTLVLVGVVARDLAGTCAGWIAAAAAAVSVPLVLQDVNLYSEGLYATTILLVVWGCYRLQAAPGPRRALLVGGAIGLAALTRAEGVLLFAAFVIVAVGAHVSWPARGRQVLAGFAGLAIVLTPWFAYNLTRFERPVVLSTGLGPLVWSSNCARTYGGRGIGAWGFVCPSDRQRFPTDQSAVDAVMLDLGLQYASNHADRLPSVLSVRMLRTFGLWHPNRVADETLELDAAGIGPLVTVAVLQYFLYVGLGAAGLLALRRRGRSLLPLVAPVVTAAVVTIIGYGSLRFRIALDAVLPVLAGVGAVALVERWQTRSAAAPLVAPG